MLCGGDTQSLALATLLTSLFTCIHDINKTICSIEISLILPSHSAGKHIIAQHPRAFHVASTEAYQFPVEESRHPSHTPFIVSRFRFKKKLVEIFLWFIKVDHFNLRPAKAALCNIFILKFNDKFTHFPFYFVQSTYKFIRKYLLRRTEK